MTGISNRVAKLEVRNGHDATERWLNSLSDKELDGRIAELDQTLRSRLAAEGIDCTGMSSKEVCAIVAEFEANRGHRPARIEREAS